MLIPFGSTSYKSRSLPLSAQRCVNLFSELEPESVKSPIALFGAPGLGIWAIAGTSVRAMRVMNNRLYVVSDNILYSVGTDQIVTSHGSVGSTFGPIMLSDNGAQLFVLNNQEGYILSTVVSATLGPLGSEQGTILSGSVATILDSHAPLDTTFVVSYTQTVTRWQNGDHVSIQLGNGNIFNTALAGIPVVAHVDFAVPLPKTVDQQALVLDSTAGVSSRATSAGAVGDLFINVQSVEGMTIGDTIEITNSDGTTFSTPITGLTRGPLVTVIAGIPSAVPAGAQISNTETRLYKIVDINFYPADTVVYFDNYFVLNRSGTNEFFLSAIGDGTTYPGLSYAAAQVMSDNVVATFTSHEMLLVFGQRSIETWYNAGAPTFPFQRYDGATIERGLGASHSIVREDNSIFFLGEDRIFYKLENNITPARLSTHAIESTWARYTTVSDAIGFSYSTEGHKFIIITFPTGNSTWVYDVATKMWHERDSIVPPSLSTQLGRWRGTCSADFANETLIGDELTGTIMKLDWDTYTELGSPIIGQVISPPFREDRKRIFVSRFELEMEVGVGLLPPSNPILYLASPITDAASTGNQVIDITADVLVPHFYTKVAADAAINATSIEVEDISDIGIGDTIQIWLNDGSVFETTVTTVYSPSNPQIFLDYSKDGGFNFSSPREPRSLGKNAARMTRVRWMSLGQAREWYFRITITDPVKRVIIGAYADMYSGMG